MIALAPEDFADLRRWAICAAVVVLAHGGFAAAMVTWHDDDEGAGPASGIVIEFASVPLAPSTPESEVAPGPLQDASEASPNKPVETLEEREKVEQKVEAKLEQKVEEKVEEKVETKPPEEPPPEAAPAPDPEVAIQPPPPQEVKQETAMRQAPSLASIASAPQVIAEETAAIPVAPVHGQPNPNDSAAVRTWRKEIVALLKRNLRFPPSADRRGQTGTVQISFGLDRHGRLIDSRVVQGTGIAEFDEEAIAVLKRSQPFPVPPSDLAGERIGLNVPIGFVPPGASAAAKR
jgi:protein TonB